MLVESIKSFSHVPFRANETKVSNSYSQPSENRDNKKLLYALAGLAAIGAGAVVIATKFKKGQIGEKEVDSAQNAIQNAVQAEVGKTDLTKAQTKINAGSVQRFDDGSYQVFDRKGVLRIEAKDGIGKYYTPDSKLLAQLDESGKAFLYDPKTDKPLMELQGSMTDGEMIPDRIKVYDKKGNVISDLSEDDSKFFIEFTEPNQKRKITLSGAGDEGVAKITNADGINKNIDRDEIKRLISSEDFLSWTSEIERKASLFEKFRSKTAPYYLKNIYNLVSYISSGVFRFF